MRNEPEQIVRRITPKWFTSVMGTGIVANAAVTLPMASTALRRGALVVWIAAAVWLTVLSSAWLLHALRYRRVARGWADDAAEAPFYGAPAMALLTVGAGALLVGRDLIGLNAALAIDWTLWTLGTLGGLASALAVPYLMFTRHELAPQDGSATWLMPVVPPMVSAATGALLVPHAPAGQPRLTLLLVCLALFGLAAIASLMVASMLWARLTHYKLPAAPLRPTLWILLGPLGQSVTAAGLMARVAPTALTRPDATGLRIFALLYGVPVWGFAILWLTLVTVITVRTIREHLAFTPSWWSFTFPLGTLVTGTSALAVRTGSVAVKTAAPILWVALLAAWLIVAGRTIADALARRRSLGVATRPSFAGGDPLLRTP
jgi:C4-dicarboxylate transporter/malic acid transport protein